MIATREALMYLFAVIQSLGFGVLSLLSLLYGFWYLTIIFVAMSMFSCLAPTGDIRKVKKNANS